MQYIAQAGQGDGELGLRTLGSAVGNLELTDVLSKASCQ